MSKLKITGNFGTQYKVVPIVLLLLLQVNCQKPTHDSLLPVVRTHEVINAFKSNATSGGEVVDDKHSFVSERGVCWSTHPEPTTDDFKTLDSSGIGPFVSKISGLSLSTTYYLRAYAKTDAGTGYGETISFTTDSDPVTVGCSQKKNDLSHISGESYYTTYHKDGLGYGTYGLLGDGNTTELKIAFSSVPRTGKYLTAQSINKIGSNECIVDYYVFLYGNTWTAEGGDTVYVNKSALGQYSMTFCNLTFYSNSSSVKVTSSGNLTN